MEQREQKEKDVGQIVRHLSITFNQATNGLDRPARTKKGVANEAYTLQTEFAHRLNEVMQGPKCMLTRNVAECNDFIDRIVTAANKQSKQ